MLDIKGKTILERQVEVLNACGVKEIAVVRGYKKEAINLPNIRYYDNDAFASTNEVESLFTAKKELGGSFVFLYGDILFEKGHLEKLLKSPADVSLLVDRAWKDAQPQSGTPAGRGAPDLVKLADAQESGLPVRGRGGPAQGRADRPANPDVRRARRVHRHGDVHRRKARALSPTRTAASSSGRARSTRPLR